MSNLTIADVMALSTLSDAASQTARVRWLDDNGEIREGVARHFVRGATDFVFIDQTVDVRDAFLRITSGGMELGLPVRDLMNKVVRGEFAIDKP